MIGDKKWILYITVPLTIIVILLFISIMVLVQKPLIIGLDKGTLSVMNRTLDVQESQNNGTMPHWYSQYAEKQAFADCMLENFDLYDANDTIIAWAYHTCYDAIYPIGWFYQDVNKVTGYDI